MKKHTLIITFTIFICCSILVAQQAPSDTEVDAFFLDLGIVIEPKTGDETINRKIQPPSEEVKIFIEKAPSGSVLMASTKELMLTLDRINKKIESMEKVVCRNIASLSLEISSLQMENDELREMVSNLAERQESFYASTPFIYLSPPTKVNEIAIKSASNSNIDSIITQQSGEGYEVSPMGLIPEDTKSVLVPRVSVSPEALPEQNRGTINLERKAGMEVVDVRVFNKNIYMGGVFAYQREDYKAALKHFLSLPLENVNHKTAGNVLYWIADCYYHLGKYTNALETLHLVKPLSESNKVDDSLILTGLIYRNIGRESKAQEAFAQVVNTFPESEYFRLAQLELRKER